jgi:fermentation-respiration switch protein FrsA (DUF1100 family)
MKWVHRIIFLGITLYSMLAATAYGVQRKLLYLPPNIIYSAPTDMMEVKTKDNHLGWYSPAQNDLPTVMVFHGNASAIDSNLHIFRDLRSAGYGVWSVGYPGYPGIEGTPSQRHIVAAAIDQYKHLTRLGVKRIVFYGTSLGSGAAAQLAAHHPPDLLILDAPFNSISDMARKNIGILPVDILLKDQWRSDKALSGLTVPLIWIHGTEDKVVPLTQGQKLYDGYRGPKSAHIIPGANHINTWLKGGRETVLDALESR